MPYKFLTDINTDLNVANFLGENNGIQRQNDEHEDDAGERRGAENLPQKVDRDDDDDRWWPHEVGEVAEVLALLHVHRHQVHYLADRRVTTRRRRQRHRLKSYADQKRNRSIHPSIEMNLHNTVCKTWTEALNGKMISD